MHQGRSGEAPVDPAVARALQKLSRSASSYYRQGRESCTEENIDQVSRATQDATNTTSKRRHAEITSARLPPSEGPCSSKYSKLQEQGNDQHESREKGLPEKHTHSTGVEDCGRFINGLLVRAKCASDLLKVFEDESTRFNGVNVSTTIHRLAKKPDGMKVLSENENAMALLGQLIVRKAEEFKPQEVGNMVWGYAKLGHMPREQV